MMRSSGSRYGSCSNSATTCGCRCSSPIPIRAPREPLLDRPMVDSRDPRDRAPSVAARARRSTSSRRKVVISGIGLSTVRPPSRTQSARADGRRLPRRHRRRGLASRATSTACRRTRDRPFTLAGTTGGGVNNIEDVLRVRPIWFGSGMEGAGQTGAVVNAMLAVVGRHLPPRALRARGVGVDVPRSSAPRRDLQSNPRVASRARWKVGCRSARSAPRTGSP